MRASTPNLQTAARSKESEKELKAERKKGRKGREGKASEGKAKEKDTSSATIHANAAHRGHQLALLDKIRKNGERGVSFNLHLQAQRQRGPRDTAAINRPFCGNARPDSIHTVSIQYPYSIHTVSHTVAGWKTRGI